jgi:hypothetical protein
MSEKRSVCIITCHDVYNAGASLQAYALMKYLRDAGYVARIIDYKPDYLSGHYTLTRVSNPRYDIPLIRWAYLAAKLPGRLRYRRGNKKKEFDRFRKEFLVLTDRTYRSFEELKEDPPAADLYLAGSDQIWNPRFQNGHDPSFYLAFADDRRKKASYAASFSADALSLEEKTEIRPYLESLGWISVREKRAVDLVREMGLEAVQVCDPVLLHDRSFWEAFADREKETEEEPYCFVYDFDGSPETERIIDHVQKDHPCRVISCLPCGRAGKVLDGGPVSFVSLIRNADFVISNSFHATVFALIFHKDFLVVPRKEDLNSRMEDLLERAGLQERFERSPDISGNLRKINWDAVDKVLEKERVFSRQYLTRVLSGT